MQKSESIFYDTVIKMTDIIEKLANEINKKESEILLLKDAINNLNNEIEGLEKENSRLTEREL